MISHRVPQKTHAAFIPAIEARVQKEVPKASSVRDIQCYPHGLVMMLVRELKSKPKNTKLPKIFEFLEVSTKRNTLVKGSDFR